jgi:hypothetical protein
MRRSLLAAILAPLALACGSHHDVQGGTGGIPDPGTSDVVDSNPPGWASVEPNDTPEEATPLGISKNGNLTPWINGNAIGGSAGQANYFVFQSAPESGEMDFDMCYDGAAITGMTASLWMVVNATQQMPPVATWTISTECKASLTAPLDGSTVYLFGVEATGGPGVYQA